ncbi:hypothetical protein NLU13_1195 [Sarocladium strictum]|uniref:Nucleoside phosphorylase domain-containing protein n=1 Tax=Sarocladium strictum TaxID=5046 RepID=A0AA39LBJ5_SARSR|nr:hypothetical protein NLU13_1195 [Sarocladium strictum]
MFSERKPPRPFGEYTVAVIFAMDFEMSAFRYMLDEEHETGDLRKDPSDPNEYVLGRVGSHYIVLAWLPGEQGKGAAAIVATHLSRTFEAIEWRLLVGIGGGVPSARHDIRLGDVVISMPERQYNGVGQYDLGRETDGGFERKGFLHGPPAYLRGVAGRMRSNHLKDDNKIGAFVSELLATSSRLKRQYQRPPSDSDVLFPGGVEHKSGLQDCHQCDKTQTENREPRDADALTEIHYGLIASGDTVVASDTSREEKISKLGADVICFEMEAAGIMSGYECLVIRGISDYADSHKTRGWRHHAAATAAACAKELLLLVRSSSTVDGIRNPSQGKSTPSSTGGNRGEPNDDGVESRYYVRQGVMATGSGTSNFGDMTFNN